MKKYNSLKMIRAGRYKVCFNGLEPEIQADVLRRMEKLIAENAEWCDRGNYGHLCNILPTLAIDQTLETRGQSPSERLAFLSKYMWAALDPRPIQRLAQMPFFMPLMKRVVPIGFKMKSGKGWRYVWHFDTDGLREFHFECTECLYIVAPLSDCVYCLTSICSFVQLLKQNATMRFLLSGKMIYALLSADSEKMGIFAAYYQCLIIL